jgi:hypothetical protein
MPWLAIGSQYYREDGDGAHRQRRSRDALVALPGTLPINLQFVDEPYDVAGFENCRVLRQDSRTMTGRPGRRKPIVSEMFDALANLARSAGCSHFAYLNADIEVAAGALDLARHGNPDAVAFSRMDRDPVTGSDLAVEIRGLDLFVVSVTWWARERHRFRTYIAGEPLWDNVYAALACMHGNGRIISDRPGVYHERHATDARVTPFSRYNGFLAALDAPYFSRWAGYVAAIEPAAQSGAPIDSDAAIAGAFLSRPIGLFERAWHAGRQLRARMSYSSHD